MDIMTAIMGAIGAAVIAATGYLKVRGEGEPFNPSKFIQTVIIGAISGFALGLTGVQITDANVAAQMSAYAFLGGGIAIVIENIGKYLYRAKVPVVVTPPEPDTSIYDPAKHGGMEVNFVPWDTMKLWVSFRVSAATKANMTSTVLSQEDRNSINAQIDKAESTNEYQYRITYSKGYYEMKAVCTPVGINEYKYQVLVASSGMDK